MKTDYETMYNIMIKQHELEKRELESKVKDLQNKLDCATSDEIDANFKSSEKTIEILLNIIICNKINKWGYRKVFFSSSFCSENS